MAEQHKQAKRRITRRINTYADLANGAEILLDKASSQNGSYYLIMASLVLSAFAFEAVLNHIGCHMFACWDVIERRLSPQQKLALLQERLDISLHRGARPYQTIKSLLNFRNALAHGRSETLCHEDRVPVGTRPFDDSRPPTVQTDWERYCTRDNAQRAREDVDQIIFLLFEAANLPDQIPFDKGSEEQFIERTMNVPVYLTPTGEHVIDLAKAEEG